MILESVRAAATCIEHDPECERTGATNALVPRALPVHATCAPIDSCTAISLAVLWSGLYSTESRERLHTWPLIFDYAKAAGYDTAYWTSQNMLFGNVRLWVKNLGVRKFVSATELDPTSDLDMGAPERYLAERVNAEDRRPARALPRRRADLERPLPVLRRSERPRAVPALRPPARRRTRTPRS